MLMASTDTVGLDVANYEENDGTLPLTEQVTTAWTVRKGALSVINTAKGTVPFHFRKASG
jgi:hypothetical protein